MGIIKREEYANKELANWKEKGITFVENKKKMPRSW